MKKLFFGFAAALAVSIPVAAQAQSYEPFPPTPGCQMVRQACYIEEGGTPFLLAIPSGYNQRYMLGITPTDSGFMVFMFNQETGTNDASMLVTGDPILLYETFEEALDLNRMMR
jgi:hypothetical protein